jgi:hypothetical protein
LIVERFKSNAEASSFDVYHSVPESYHIGIEVRSKTKGDKEGESGQAIENAASQVLRGLNGFVETLNQNTQLLDGHPHAYILPVIFTTADIWGSDTNLSEADLKTGVSDVNDKELKPLGWLCYQYHTSPGIKHSRSPDTKPSALGTYAERIHPHPSYSKPYWNRSFLRMAVRASLRIGTFCPLETLMLFRLFMS